MNQKKIFAAVFLIFFSLAAFSKTKTTVKDIFSIDFRLNTKSDDGKNHLNWTTSSKKIKDKYDSVSGASVSHSTGELFSVIHGTNPKTLLAPKGLRSLLLFAVSSQDFLQKDNFQVARKNDGKIKITFTHRNVDYLILSDEKGSLDLEKSFFIKQNLEKKQDSKQEQLADSKLMNTDEKDGHELDEENLPKNSSSPVNQDDKNELPDSAQVNADEKNEDRLVEDGVSEENLPEGFLKDKSDEKSKYSGRLKLTLKNDVLLIKGKLKLAEITEIPNEE